jgi:hypothetical protein
VDFFGVETIGVELGLGRHDLKPRGDRVCGLLLSAKHEGAAVAESQRVYVIGGMRDGSLQRAVTENRPTCEKGGMGRRSLFFTAGPWAYDDQTIYCWFGATPEDDQGAGTAERSHNRYRRADLRTPRAEVAAHRAPGRRHPDRATQLAR